MIHLTLDNLPSTEEMRSNFKTHMLKMSIADLHALATYATNTIVLIKQVGNYIQEAAREVLIESFEFIAITCGEEIMRRVTVMAHNKITKHGD